MNTVLHQFTRTLFFFGALSSSSHVLAHGQHDSKKPPQVDAVSHLGKAHLAKLSNITSNNAASVIDAQFSFDGNINEESGDYNIELFGVKTENYESRDDNQAFSLADRTWLELPQELHNNIQTDTSLSLSLDFYFKNTGVDESVRVLLSNKDWSYAAPGLKITVLK